MYVEAVEDAIRRVLPVIEAGWRQGEPDTRLEIIDPILRSLGWYPGYGDDEPDPYCITEYYPYADRCIHADYAMFDPFDQFVLAVEAKKLREHTQNHYSQLEKYMAAGGLDMVGVLTNGQFWNICYLGAARRLREELPIGLSSRPPAESARRLFQALARSNWH